MLLSKNEPIDLSPLVLKSDAFKRGDLVFPLQEDYHNRPGYVLGAGLAKGSLAIQFDHNIESVFACWLTYPSKPEFWSASQLSYYWKNLIPQLGKNWLGQVQLRDAILGEWRRERPDKGNLPSPPPRTGGVYISDPDAFRKLQQIEGQDFIAKINEDFAPILAHLTERQPLTSLHGMTIYGRAGQNRYPVYPDGEIRIMTSKDTGSGKLSTERALKLGFRLA